MANSRLLWLMGSFCLLLVATRGDFLSDYLFDKRFGPDPGPCPDSVDRDVCQATMEPELFSEGAGNAYICFFENTCFWETFLGCGLSVTACNNVRDWFHGGTIRVRNLECEDISFDSWEAESEVVSDTEVSTTFTGLGLNTRCDSYVRFDAVHLEDGIFGLTLTGDTRFRTSPTNAGSTMAFTAVFNPEEGTFAESFPDTVAFDGGDCSIGFDVDSDLDLLQNNGESWEQTIFCVGFLGCAFSLDWIDLGSATQTLAEGVEAAFGSVICTLLEEAGEPTTALRYLNEQFRSLSGFADSFETMADLDANPMAENDLIADQRLTDANVAASVDFSTDSIIEIVSVGLNDWLGQFDDEKNRPVVNDLVEGLFGSNGEFNIDLEAEGITFEGTFETAIFNALTRLTRFRIEGLNSITDFSALNNNYDIGSTPADRNKYTLSHNIDFTQVTFVVAAEVTLQRGSWVSESSCYVPGVDGAEGEFDPDCSLDQTRFDFEVAMTWLEFSTALTTFTVVQPGLLDNVLVGQIFGMSFSEDAVGGIKRVMNCLAPAFHVAYVPFFEFSMVDVVTPMQVNFEQPENLEEFIEDIILMLDRLYSSALTNLAPGIGQGYVRQNMNDFLTENVALPDDLGACPEYFPGNINENQLHFLFNEGLLNNIFPVINDVLGDFEGDTSTDMNDLVQAMLEYFSEAYDEFPLSPENGVVGQWAMKPDQRVLATVPGFETSEARTRTVQLRDLEIDNLDSIYALQGEPFTGGAEGGKYSFELDFNFGQRVLGSVVEEAPMRFIGRLNFVADQVVSQIGADETPVDLEEEMVVTIELDQMVMNLILEDLKINRESLYVLGLGQLSHVPCLLTTLDNGASGVKSSLFAEEAFVQIGRTNTGNVGLHPFVGALDALATSTSNGATPKMKQMVNTILNNGFLKLLEELENVDSTVNAGNCEAEEDPLASLIAMFTGIDLSSVAGQIGECLEPIPDGFPLSPDDALGLVELPPDASWFDMSDSAIIAAFEGQFGSTEEDPELRNDILKSIVFALADESGTPLSDSFYIGEYEGDEVVIFELQTNEENFLFDLFAMEPLIFTDDSIIPGLNAQVEQVKITGVDRFTGRTVLLDVQNQWVHSYAFEFSRDFPLLVELTGFIETSSAFIEEGGTGTIREEFQVEMVVKGFTFEMDILTAIDTELFGNLTLGHFFEVTPGNQDFELSAFALECAFSTMFEGGVFIPKLNMSLQELDGPILTTTNEHFISEEVATFTGELLRLGSQFYYEGLPNLAHNCFRESTNEFFVQQWKDSQGGACPNVNVNTNALPEEDHILRFGESTGIARFQTFLDDNLKAENYELWNVIIESMTTTNGIPIVLFDQPSDYLGVQNLDMTYKDVPYGELTVIAKDIKIVNLSTFQGFKLIEPQVDEGDNSSLYRATTGFNISGPVAFDFLFDIVAEDIFQNMDDTVVPGTMTNNLAMVVEFTSWNFTLDLYMELNVTEALNIRFSSVSSLNEIPCLLAPFDAIRPENFEFNASQIDVSLQCAGSCEFPLFQDDLEDGAVLDSQGNAVVREMVDELIRFLEEYIEGTGFQAQIDSAIESADEDCAELLGLLTTLIDPEIADPLNAALYMVYAFTALLGGSFFGCCALLPLHYRRSRTMLEKFAAKRKTMLPEKELLLFKLSLRSIAMHPSTHAPVRILVPFFAFFHIIILVVALSPSSFAMNLVVLIELLGATTNHIVLVQFTILSTVNDVWNSDAQWLAILIALASCAWPILKNVLLFVTFYLPPTILGQRRRTRLLFVMDMVGKWSFLDVFIVVMTLAAVRTSVALSAYSRFEFLPEGSLSADVNVTPERGIILLMIAASSSLILNHVIAAYNDKMVKYNQTLEDQLRGVLKTTPKKALAKKRVWNHKFAGLDKNGRRKVISPTSAVVLTVVNVVSGGLLVLGIFLPLVSFDTGGLVGRLSEEIDGTPPVRTYSILGLALLMGESPTINGIDVAATLFFQFLLLLTSCFFPLVLIFINTFILRKGLSLSSAKYTLWAQYIAVFWSANEVFIAAVFFTLLEIDRLTIFIVDFISEDFCANIESLLATLTDITEDNECITISGRMQVSGFVVVIGLIGQWISTIFTMNIVESAVQDRYFQIYNGVRQDVRPPKSGFIRKLVMKWMTMRTKKRMNSGPVVVVEDKEDHESLLDGLGGDDVKSFAPSVAQYSPGRQVSATRQVSGTSGRGNSVQEDTIPPSRISFQGVSDMHNTRVQAEGEISDTAF